MNDGNIYIGPLPRELAIQGIARSIYTIKWMLFGAVVGSSIRGSIGAWVGGLVFGGVGLLLDEGILKEKEKKTQEV